MSRDRILEEALKHELRGVSAPPGESCVDAETLAAWEDEALDANAVLALEAHVSNCSRCQALVATTVRSTQAPSTQAPSTQAPSTQAPRHLGTEAPNPFGWRWLVPLGAAAAAVTLWMVVPEQREVALAPPQPAAAVVETAKPEAAGVEAPASSDSARLQAPAAPVRERRNEAATEKKQAAPAESRKEERADAAAQKPLEVRDSAAASIADRAAARTASPTAPPPSPSAPAPAAAPQAAQESAAPAIAGLQRNRFALTPFEIVSSDASQRWRVTAAGVERSLDIGATWSLVRAASGDTITAGVSPRPNVCWLIGDNGVVLLTTDGSVFTRSVIPDAGSLRSISATDAQSATVVNAAGRTFRTGDGGRTWR